MKIKLVIIYKTDICSILYFTPGKAPLTIIPFPCSTNFASLFVTEILPQRDSLSSGQAGDIKTSIRPCLYQLTITKLAIFTLMIFSDLIWTELEIEKGVRLGSAESIF